MLVPIKLHRNVAETKRERGNSLKNLRKAEKVKSRKQRQLVVIAILKITPPNNRIQ